MRPGLRLSAAGAILLAAALLAWGAREHFADNPNDIEPARLAPQLLRDQAAMGEYLAAFPLAEYKIYEVEGQGRFYLDGLDDVIKRPLRKGVMWEPYLVTLIPQHIKPGTTVIDAGAHIGTHTMTMARTAGRKGRVYSFEPQKKIYRELVRNVELNGLRNVVPLRFALGDRHEVIEMSRSVAGNEGGTGVGPGGDKAELRTIDSFGFRNVSFIKIDVEGFEDHVLDGAAQTIKAQHPVLLVEIQGGEDYDKAPPKIRQRIEQTIAKLKAYGYAVKRVSRHDYLATWPAP
jgi:FkbM family methyltransferase